MERKFPKFFKTQTTFVFHLLLIHSMVCQHYPIFWSYPVLTDIFKAELKSLTQLSEHCLAPIVNFQCPSEKEFPEFFKTPIAFNIREIMMGNINS